MGKRQTVHVIACGVLGPEIKYLADEMGLDLQMNFLPGKLHNNPDLLRTTLQGAIDLASEDSGCCRIIIGYGLCGKGTVNVRANRVPLVFPKIHDCIALFLGSDRIYREQFHKYPGTYYLTEGWHNEKDHKRGDGETVWINNQAVGCADLEEKYGEKGGKDVIDFFRSWTSNYQRAVYIDTGIARRGQSLQAAQQMAEKYDWDFQRFSGDLTLLKKLLISCESDNEIVFVPAGHKTIFSGNENCLGSSPLQEENIPEKNGIRQRVFERKPADNRNVGNVRCGLGIDAGGTFTDGVIYDFDTGTIIAKNKALTTKWDYSAGINNCLAGLPFESLQGIDFVSVSTTLATNAIVEGDGQKVGLLFMGPISLCNNMEITHSPKASIKGLMTIRGEEVDRVDPEEIRRVVNRMRDQDKVGAFAVSGYGGSINPLHEQQVRDIIVEETGMVVCSGHDFSSKLDFTLRAQTAVINGRVIPIILRFFIDLERVLDAYDLDVPVMVVKGDGTLVSKNVAKQRPVETVFSGPAASVAGAKQLTGMHDAMVVDIGGTTTDSADIIGGEVNVSSVGAVVGGLRTHVRALEMKTIGLGGDSHIKLTDGTFTLGPNRVAPLVWANTINEEGIDRALASIAVARIHGQEQTILVALEGELTFVPSPVEKKIYELLLESPQTPEQVAGCLGILSGRLLRLERLEHFGLVQRCGLTPTDIFHVINSIDLYPSAPAHHMLAILSRSLTKDTSRLAEELLHLIYHKLGVELLNNSIFGGFPRADLEKSPLYNHICDALLDRKETKYDLKASFKHAIIGIGAPSSLVLPKAAETLQAKVMIPEDGDVANALGAVTSQVVIRQNITIRPDSRGYYVVEGVIDTPAFVSLKEAEDWSLSHLSCKLREDAVEAGTIEQRVVCDIEDRNVIMKDGSAMLLERNISAYIKGTPYIERSAVSITEQ